MKKIYFYAALLISYSFLFRTLKTSDYLLVFIVSTAILLISSKLYKFQDGKKLEDTYKNLPIVKLLAFLFKDKGIMNSQNLTSLNVLIVSAVYVLSMIISFHFFGETTRHFLLLMGCVSFSLIFTKVFLNRYVQKNN